MQFVIIQQIEGEGIVRNHAKERPGLVRCHVLPFQDLPDQFQRLAKFFQAFGIDGISSDQVIPHQPDIQLYRAVGITVKTMALPP